MTRTTCPYCGVGCGIALVDGALCGDRDHPANFGQLCSKGAALKDTLALPDRLTMPMLHGRPASWDDALDFIAAEFTRIRTGTGQRIFLMAPLHHHFEKKGWHESQVVMRFYILCVLCAVVALATLKLR